jgi:hypothetical protein
LIKIFSIGNLGEPEKTGKADRCSDTNSAWAFPVFTVWPISAIVPWPCWTLSYNSQLTSFALFLSMSCPGVSAIGSRATVVAVPPKDPAQ